MNIKKFVKDSMLNIVSAALPILFLQLIVFPFIGKSTSVEGYGLFIAFVSLFTLVSFPLGNVLNNVRLLMEEDYRENEIKGDFNPILIGMSFLSLIMIWFASLFIDQNIDNIDITLLCMITILSVWKEYLIVSFRLVLNYRRILFNNVLICMGFFVGLISYKIVGYWQLVYLMGLSFSLMYIMKFSKLHKEPIKFTFLYKRTASKSFQLYLASLLKNTLNYADKLVLLPLIGPTGVAIYYTSTIIGKIIIMMVNPINSVILSYLVKIDKVSLMKFLKAFSLAIVVACVGYSFTILFSPLFLIYFYSSWAKESLELIYITTATVCIDMLATILHPFNLRFNKSSWQIYMNLSHVIVYILSASYFYLNEGLIGFCFGILVASLYKLVLQLGVFLYGTIKLSKNSKF